MPIKIDIHTRRFGKDDTAWRLFPGTGYRHYDVMREYKRIFLDLPNLPLISAAPLEKNRSNLKVISSALDAAPFILREDQSGVERLSEILSQEKNPTKWSNKRALALSWVNSLYADAKQGDLVVVPGPGLRRTSGNQYEWAPTLIGEITTNTQIWTENGPNKYLNARFLTRAVRWREEATEADLSGRAQLALRTQNALVKIDANELNNVLGAAFKNVITNDEVLARFITNNKDPRSYELHQFLSFIQASTAAIKAANEGTKLTGSSIYEIAGQMRRDTDFVLEQDANFHSPGYSTLIAAFEESAAKIKNFPLVVACLFALASTADADPFDQNGNPSVEVVNSETTSVDPCSPEIGVDKDVRDTLRIIGYERWQQWCEAASAASTNDGFRSVTTIVGKESD